MLIKAIREAIENSYKATQDVVVKKLYKLQRQTKDETEDSGHRLDCLLGLAKIDPREVKAIAWVVYTETETGAGVYHSGAGSAEALQLLCKSLELQLLHRASLTELDRLESGDCYDPACEVHGKGVDPNNIDVVEALRAAGLNVIQL